jgi:hypothetical protein
MIDEPAGLTLAQPEDEVPATGRFWEHVLGGLVLAVVSAAIVLYSAYHGWITDDLSTDWAYAGVGFGFLFFALGAFVFSFGWESGDIEKALRLTFFICLIMLATVIALLILVKSKGTAAKSAGDVGAAAVSSDGYDPLPVLRAVGSMLTDGEEEPAEKAPDLPQTLFQIKCPACGATFAPVPPAAKCPFCNEPALAE